jgi:hypothetical protein
MDAFKNNIKDILTNIDYELKIIDDKLKAVDESVERDLEILLNKHIDQINKAELDINSLRDRYRITLLNKRKTAFEVAKDELARLRNQISIKLTPDLETCADH